MRPAILAKRTWPVLFLLLLEAAPPLAAGKPASAVPSNPEDRAIVHVLDRMGFGPRPGDVDRVRAMGLQAYIEQQLRPERLSDEAMAGRLASLPTVTLSSREIVRDYLLPVQLLRRQQQQQQQQRQQQAPQTGASQESGPARTPELVEAARNARAVLDDISSQKLLRAIYSERQLDELMVDFWFNHFNVFAAKGATRGYVTEYERDVIRPHVLGRFRDLLEATAKSPAMLFYLDNWQSAAAAGVPTTASRERTAAASRRIPVRRGQTLLPPRQPSRPAVPTRQAPRGINENYARELMELQTLGVDGGYTQKDVQEVARAFTGWTIERPRLGGGFRFEPRLHDDGEKIVLGHRIKAGGGESDGERVLDILARHPSTSRFIATKLVRRFVSDDPPPSLVERAARRFRDTDGDIREVVRTIVTSPEMFAPAAYRAKVKTPFEFVVSAMRATGAESSSAVALAAAARDLGMPLYMCQPPTGYADRAGAWVNTGALLNRMNFAVALTGNRLRGVRMPDGAMVADAGRARDALVGGVLAGDISPATAATIARAERAPQAIALVIGSPEFQRK
jgi:uncharacterized protein (DUF1800 family)